MSEKEYAFADIEPSWNWQGEFASREEAAEEATLQFPNGFVTGEIRKADHADVYPAGRASALLDAMIEDEQVESGTHIESYVIDIYRRAINPARDGVDTQIIADLEQRIKQAFVAWLETHFEAPNWFYIKDDTVQEHKGQATV